MKKQTLFLFIFTLVALGGVFYFTKSQNNTRLNSVTFNTQELKNGDIIFQASLSTQSKAIQLASHSEWSHCGIIYKEGDEYFVYEAVQPVKLTPLEKWIVRGDGQKFVVKRLKNADAVLTPKILQKMKTAGEKFKGKDYDLYFEWTDERIYCSELIWKIYQEATGIELGELQQLHDFDLTNKIVQAKMKERYGEKTPMDEKVISPVAIMSSPLLVTVQKN